MSYRPQVIVCQLGARRRYAVPRMLQGAGMLAALYTDSSAQSLLGRFGRMMGSTAPPSIKRLVRREVKDIPPNKIYSTDCLQIPGLGLRRPSNVLEGTVDYRKRHTILSEKMKKWGMQGAEIIYTMYHENLDFVRWAKSQGAKSVIDVYINPMTALNMLDESSRFPDWGVYKSKDNVNLGLRLWEETAELADVLLCPSEWVAEGIREATPHAVSKIQIVPYGCSIDYGGRTSRPVPGRVLFAGGHALRKGLHYLAEASTQLKRILPQVEVRVAGKFPPEVVSHPLCKDLTFLGKLNSTQMGDEYLSADTFVLPSLSEGFAGVVAEAIGAGCPVIVTKEAGSPVIDGQEGLVIPSRNVDALVDAVQRLVTDRDLRDRLAQNCRDRFSYYSEHEWQKRLIRCIEGTLRVP